MILLDTETTGLVAPEASPIDNQPRITEFFGLKLNDETLEEEGSIGFLVNPGIPIPAEVVKITGITDEMVKGEPPFVARFAALSAFFLGQQMMVAHNLSFDKSLMTYDLMRIGKLTHFPWPPKQVCTVEASMHLRGHRLRLTALHEIATGQPHTDAHRAEKDVRALATVVRWMRAEGML